MADPIATMQANNAALAAAVAAEDNVVDSAIVLLNSNNTTVSGLQQQLEDAIAAQNMPAIQAVSDSMAAFVTDINARTASLAVAVANGTGAPVTAPTVPVAPVP